MSLFALSIAIVPSAIVLPSKASTLGNASETTSSKSSSDFKSFIPVNLLPNSLHALAECLSLWLPISVKPTAAIIEAGVNLSEAAIAASTFANHLPGLIFLFLILPVVASKDCFISPMYKESSAT